MRTHVMREQTCGTAVPVTGKQPLRELPQVPAVTSIKGGDCFREDANGPP
jgi:hypothetical protein